MNRRILFACCAGAVVLTVLLLAARYRPLQAQTTSHSQAEGKDSSSRSTARARTRFSARSPRTATSPRVETTSQPPPLLRSSSLEPTPAPIPPAKPEDSPEPEPVDYDKLIAEMSEDLKLHPERFPAYLERFRNEQDPKMVISLWRVIKDSAFASSDETLNMALGFVADPMRERRFAAVSLLCETQEVSPGILRSVSMLAQEGNDWHARLDAITVLGEWLVVHPELGPELNQALLPQLSPNADWKLARATLQFLAQPNAVKSEPMVSTLVELLVRSTEPVDLRLTAMALGSVTDPSMQQVVSAQLKQSYQLPHDTQTRREFLSQLVRISGQEALGFLQEVAPIETDQAVLEDIQEYTQILLEGARDAEEIRKKKEQLDSQQQESLTQ